MSHNSEPLAAPLAVRWEGPFATTHSFALTNRALCLRLLQRGHRLALHPAGLGQSDAILGKFDRMASSFHWATGTFRILLWL